MSRKICPACGYVDEQGAEYCRQCGVKMEEARENGTGQGGQFSNSNYQDYTSNMSYRAPVEEYRPENGTNGLQIAGLVCGILAICSCCCYGVPAVILGIAGIVCASMGNKSNKSGVGTAGFICSIIGLILGVISAIYYGWALAQVSRMDYNELQQLMDMFQ